MADILIRGMEMPEPGQSILVAQNWDGSIYARLDSNGNFCPLVSLPEGHGRLGDLDSLYQALIAHEFTMSAVDMLEVIANAETIVPAEGGD